MKLICSNPECDNPAVAIVPYSEPVYKQLGPQGCHIIELACEQCLPWFGGKFYLKLKDTPECQALVKRYREVTAEKMARKLRGEESFAVQWDKKSGRFIRIV